MVEKYGMGKSLEVFSASNSASSENVRYNIDKEIMEIVNYCYNEAKSILMAKSEANEQLLKLLLSDTVLSGETVRNIVNSQ
jgi:ATP-dependent Zn protease